MCVCVGGGGGGGGRVVCFLFLFFFSEKIGLSFHVNRLTSSLVSSRTAHPTEPPRMAEMPVVNANSADPDQTPHSAASDDLGLHCLPKSHVWDARHKQVKDKKTKEKYTKLIYII